MSSRSDLAQSSRAGISVVFAHGHDGSIYRASVDSKKAIDAISVAHAEAMRRLARDLGASFAFVDQFWGHVGNLALRRAGLVTYHYQLSRDLEGAWKRGPDGLDGLVDAIARFVGS